MGLCGGKSPDVMIIDVIKVLLKGINEVYQNSGSKATGLNCGWDCFVHQISYPLFYKTFKIKPSSS